MSAKIIFEYAVAVENCMVWKACVYTIYTFNRKIWKKHTDNIAGYTAMQFILFGFLLLFGLFVALSLYLAYTEFGWYAMQPCVCAHGRPNERVNKWTANSLSMSYKFLVFLAYLRMHATKYENGLQIDQN